VPGRGGRRRRRCRAFRGGPGDEPRHALSRRTVRPAAQPRALPQFTAGGAGRV
jgi:hypothetical protein